MEPAYKAGILSGIIFWYIGAFLFIFLTALERGIPPEANILVAVGIALIGGAFQGLIGGTIIGAIFKYTHKKLPTQNSIVKAFIMFLIIGIIMFVIGWIDLVSLAISTIPSGILYGILYDRFVKKETKIKV